MRGGQSRVPARSWRVRRLKSNQVVGGGGDPWRTHTSSLRPPSLMLTTWPRGKIEPIGWNGTTP